MKSLKSQLRVRELFGSSTFGRNFAQLEFVAFFGGADIQTKGKNWLKPVSYLRVRVTQVLPTI